MLNSEISNRTSSPNHLTIWKECLKNIKENVSLMTYNTWFLPIKPLGLEGKNLRVQLPSQFFWEWIDEHYNALITKTIKLVLGSDAKLSYIINEDTGTTNAENLSSKIKPHIKQASLTKQNVLETNLNQRYTFDNFIKGDGNQLARAAALAISDNPGGTSFNPLFIYGGVGLGKTHIIQAAGNKILHSMPDKKIIYMSADTFTVAFVEAIRSNSINEFSSFYRRMDVLIIDDIQFLIGKEKTQDLFFHIFNTLHQSRKQIILSSDRPPKDLKSLDDRLISRFQWGLTADIQPPELETRIAILNRKASDYGMDISPEIIDYIANNITSNIRELEGCLIKLLASSSLNSANIDIDLAKKTVVEIATDRKVNVTVEIITKAVCSYLNIAENKIRDKTRKKEIVIARQIAMYLSKELTKSSLKSIGLQFGGRDHSTVIHACRAVDEEMNSDTSFREMVKTLKNQVQIISS